ncbi:hypothetical protein MJO28_013655 [Puccinia striiformis f. sp. tritici]|uniref:Major facilitator superfamily (MFS) profile domain-containing protein n=2 Tax=Puccinia striiformis f. sp. tritici TaxID=168172 RepID=A0A0L0VWU7_9BASI|nr:hypothetical protein Pst134EA_025843 [Puccinia striiformis f. sp. tritici]KNF03672.1 hypothetical protein PSTG_03192 [Puccinia striiformis f. sp. tritici PST-78]KAH9444026.1 hypothetical protein Pst134EB_026414 [Puccinia striiformis f. sp. tritici]KAH9451904.1 hypothetical protein Pst134EA_025843 [Puccinia striiformis f. sp. tritici]KAI7940003.1 hypothetical protein MJO28_013655 [Puccinia striiformis f. sp. tritici]KAI7941421.1 hypothetical protein MJO29_013495 [Puccinia striiformis f. sp. 
MDPSVLSSHELTTFHSPPNEDQATISSRAKNIAPTDNDDKNDTRSDVAFQSPASKDREKNLAQIDGGFFAWRYIFLSFLVEGYVWGIPLSFGVFLDYPPYSEMTSTMAAIIGTLCTGILYCVGSFVLSLMENFPKSALYLPTIGTLVCSASFLAASYSTNAWHLLLCQGIMYGIGGALLYYPALFFLSEWWVVRRGLAGSIMFAGTSVFGLILPPVLDWSLKKYGTPMTLRGLGAAFFIGMAPILPFFRGRLPVSVRRRAPPAPTRKYLKRPIFWAFNCLNLLQSLSFFVPTLYMPTYATSIGSPGGIVLGLFAGSSIIGQIVTGGLSDHYDLSWIIGVTSVASSVSIFVLWGHSEGFAMLAAFAIVYGISAGGFSCLWQRFAMIIAPSEANSGSLVVYFATSRGIANVLTGPIAGALLQNSPSTKAGYKSLVYYSGSLMILCTLGVSMKGLYRIIRN